MKQLKPTNLIAVEVPGDAFDIKKMDNCSMSFRHNKDYEGDAEFSSVVVLHHQDYKLGHKVKYLGEVTKNGVQFDVESYIVRYKITSFSKVPDVYYDYVHDGFDFKTYTQKYKESMNKTFPFETPQESFQSLLQANNIEIPEGKKLLILLKK